MGRDRSLDEFFATSDDEGRENDADDERVAGDPDTDEEVEETADTDEEVEETADNETEATADTDEETSGAERTEPDESTESTEPDESTENDERPRPTATYRWSPDGDDCPVCGTVVEKQWRDGDQFVCADCKEW